MSNSGAKRLNMKNTPIIWEHFSIRREWTPKAELTQYKGFQKSQGQNIE
jgi:hypothetical protein